jgi:hypothetical protein
MKANAQGLSNLVQPLKVGYELCWVKNNVCGSGGKAQHILKLSTSWS